jgi:hypothetical protein
MKTINDITDVGGFDFEYVMKYYEGYITDDEQLRRNALKWLKGETTKPNETGFRVRELLMI